MLPPRECVACLKQTNLDHTLLGVVSTVGYSVGACTDCTGRQGGELPNLQCELPISPGSTAHFQG